MSSHPESRDPSEGSSTKQSAAHHERHRKGTHQVVQRELPTRIVAQNHDRVRLLHRPLVSARRVLPDLLHDDRGRGLPEDAVKTWKELGLAALQIHQLESLPRPPRIARQN